MSVVLIGVTHACDARFVCQGLLGCISKAFSKQEHSAGQYTSSQPFNVLCFYAGEWFILSGDLLCFASQWTAGGVGTFEL